MSYLVGSVLVASVAVAAQPTGSHTDEIKLFASTMAIAQVVSDRCPDILINAAVLKGIRDRLKIRDEVDGQTLVEEGRGAMAIFIKAINQAPTVQAWCDATYRFYGPDGRFIRGLMLKGGAVNR